MHLAEVDLNRRLRFSRQVGEDLICIQASRPSKRLRGTHDSSRSLSLQGFCFEGLSDEIEAL